jgi:hypothetical protein
MAIHRANTTTFQAKQSGSDFRAALHGSTTHNHGVLSPEPKQSSLQSSLHPALTCHHPPSTSPSTTQTPLTPTMTARDHEIPSSNLRLQNKHTLQTTKHNMPKLTSATKQNPNPRTPQRQVTTPEINNERPNKPNTRLSRAYHASQRFLASELRALHERREYTWRERVLRFIPGFVIGFIGGVLAWQWIERGWRPWARGSEEQALWCRSTRAGASIL